MHVVQFVQVEGSDYQEVDPIVNKTEFNNPPANIA